MSAMAEPKSFRDKLEPKGPKKLLALDGGGILGVLSLEFLARIEDVLRPELRRGDDFVLADYFDYIAGTSTGAIIATCLALGMPVAKVRQFYHDRGEEMFSRAGLFTRLFYSKYSQAKLERMLKEKIAEETDEGEATLGSEKLRTLLMVVLRNATTDSPWPLSNNPNAAFNDRDRPNCNLKLPLWQIVRASTAAPMYFPPERITLGGRPFLFVDGGVTIFNNPSSTLRHGDRRRVPPGLARRRGPAPAGLDRHRPGSRRQRQPPPGKYPPLLPGHPHPLGPDGCRQHTAGFPLQGSRQVPSRCPDRPRGPRLDHRGGRRAFGDHPSA